jgi:hypothetical protein
MSEFQWRKFGGDHWNNPLAPAAEVEFVGLDGPIIVPGLFDTGADSTELPTVYRQQLGIGLDKCAAMKAHGAWVPFTVVEARLDGHVFDLPVTFVDVHLPDGTALVLFGRVGILEHFSVSLAPQMTRFEWIEGSTAPLVAAYDNWLVEWLKAHGDQFKEGVDY